MPESVQAAIGPLANFTDMLSGEEQVTLSAVRAVLHILMTEVLADSSGDTMLTSDMKSSILDYMESMENKCTLCINCRFILFHSCCSKIEGTCSVL